MKLIGLIVIGALAFTVGISMMLISPVYQTAGPSVGYLIGIGLAALGGLLALAGTLRFALGR